MASLAPKPNRARERIRNDSGIARSHLRVAVSANEVVKVWDLDKPISKLDEIDLAPSLSNETATRPIRSATANEDDYEVVKLSRGKTMIQLFELMGSRLQTNDRTICSY